MQKKLIALAIAGLSSAAFAQSNVTIYGVADASFESVKATGANPTGPAATAVDYVSRSRTQANSSLIGFKGAESLGNGLTAVFQFETGINLDGNASNSNATLINGGNLFGAQRDTMVALAGGFGTVAAGYLSSPYRSTAASFDVMPGATGVGSAFNLIGNINTGAVLQPLTAAGYNSGNTFGGTANATLDTNTVLPTAGNVVDTPATANKRVTITARHNALAYISPTVGGFTGVIAYVPNESKDSAASFATTTNESVKRDPHAWNVALSYNNGPLSLAYSWLSIKDAGVVAGLGTVTAATSPTALVIVNGQEDHKAQLFGAKYTFGGATTVSFMYEKFDGEVGLTSAAATALGQSSLTADRNAWWLGVKHVFGASEIAASYGKANEMKSNANAATLTQLGGSAAASVGNSGAKNFNLRYGYNMSKRTQLYAVYSKITNDANGNYDFNTFGGAATATTTRAGADPQAIGVGLRHTF